MASNERAADGPRTFYQEVSGRAGELLRSTTSSATGHAVRGLVISFNYLMYPLCTHQEHALTANSSMMA
jgi:hypothetical protein